jgi:uncharacterized OB-fold protein
MAGGVEPEAPAPPKPIPVFDDLSGPYWRAAREGRLLLQRCRGCGEHQFYPRPFCMACRGSELEWIEATGRGRLHTFSVVHRTADRAFAGEVPYVFAVVELDEGPRLTVNVVDTPLEALRCDMPVQMAFTEIDAEITVPNARGET